MVDVLIVGGGLDGSLAAWHLHTTRPDCVVSLLEAGDTLGGNHTWSFHATDLPPAAGAWMAPLVTHRWPRHDVRFPSRSRSIDHEYCAITSERLHEVVSRALGHRARLRAQVDALTPTSVRLADGAVLAAGVVIDARGAEPLDMPLGWQTFLGQDLVCERPHGVVAPMIMDATVPQAGAFKFIYVLPWSADRLLVEDTAYADTPRVDVEAASSTLGAAATCSSTTHLSKRASTGASALSEARSSAPASVTISVRRSASCAASIQASVPSASRTLAQPSRRTTTSTGVWARIR